MNEEQAEALGQLLVAAQDICNIYYMDPDVQEVGGAPFEAAMDALRDALLDACVMGLHVPATLPNVESDSEPVGAYIHTFCPQCGGRNCRVTGSAFITAPDGFDSLEPGVSVFCEGCGITFVEAEG